MNALIIIIKPKKSETMCNSYMLIFIYDKNNLQKIQLEYKIMIFVL